MATKDFKDSTVAVSHDINDSTKTISDNTNDSTKTVSNNVKTISTSEYQDYLDWKKKNKK
jgi:hypothetical protein